MRRVLFALLLLGLTALPAAGQCVGGHCTLPPRVQVLPPDGINAQLPQPTPAWRYERAEKYRAAVVRVWGNDTAGHRSIGSGVFVRFGDATAVLTARHVVQDVTKVFVEFHSGKSYPARVLKADATWDCAVLEVDGAPEGIQPAEMEWGTAAMLHSGDRLESCGYGPDGRLAVNSGVFLGYRRPSTRPTGPDDWVILSGRARGGDSGGPIFNRLGHVVGVLWGTDGSEVVGVQAGRVHLLLRAALPRGYQQQQIVARTPTPPMTTPPMTAPLVPVVPPASASESGRSDSVLAGRSPILPWRSEAEKRDEAQRAAIDRLIELERLRQADRDTRPPAAVTPPMVATPPAGTPTPEEKPPAASPSPLLAGLCVLAGAALGFVIYFANEKGNGNG